MMCAQDKKIYITSLPRRRFDGLVIMRTPHPPHPLTERVLGYRWLLGFVQIGPIDIDLRRDAINAVFVGMGGAGLIFLLVVVPYYNCRHLFRRQ